MLENNMEMKFIEAGRKNLKYIYTQHKDGDIDGAVYVALLRIEVETSRKKHNIFHHAYHSNIYTKLS